jgi:hypothetical protein
LLLSASILNYPVPVLINWGAEEAADAYVQHLAKVWTILSYLDLLSNGGKGSDLVLIVDGFDIHFQLPPEVLLSRYFSENARANLRIEAQIGRENMLNPTYEQTVIFGHDKICWPMNYERPACWAIPESSDPRSAYGPKTDSDPPHGRARWLNSGTVMGPVDHVRDIFKATLDLIHKNHTTDSDQFYFANVFGMQELDKRMLLPDPMEGVNTNDVDIPKIEKGVRYQFGIGLDYEAVLFQTMAFFRQYITWMRFDGVKKPMGRDLPQVALLSDPYYEKVLPADIAAARGPYHAAIATKSQTLPTHTTWRDLILGINVISNQIFPVLHFTGPKEFRHLWWTNLWFIEKAEELQKASTAMMKGPRQPFQRRKFGGRVWWPAEMKNQSQIDLGEKGGVWSDNGTFLGWGDMCGAFEPALYGQKQ